MDYKTFLNQKPEVKAFFDEKTNTISYVVADTETKKCVIVDSVADYEPQGATLSFESAEKIIDYVKEKEYSVELILETHVHADHLSAASFLKERLGGEIAINKNITNVQNFFGKVFEENTTTENNENIFDKLFEDMEEFKVGNIKAIAMHVPGHTPSDMAFIIGNAVFVGDTLFMPDYGSARCDFPGGSAEKLYESVQKLFSLPEEMRMFMCHDYLPKNRTEYVWETTVAEQKKNNIHLKEGTSLAEFKEMRESRDKTLSMPKLIIPSLQVNIKAGELPKKSDISGNQYLKIPINSVFSKKQ